MRIALVVGLLVALAGCGGGERRSVFGLEVGDCFDDPDASQTDEVPIVDCEQPHDNEVFAIVQHPAAPDEPYPGRDAVIATGNELCEAQFAPYVGRDYAASRLYIQLIITSDETWSKGDREIVCALYEADGGKMRGSRRGSGV